MGYTNYWSPKKLSDDQIPDGFWDDSIAVLDAVLRKGIRLGDGVGENEYKSGKEIVNATTMTDHEYPSIVFNGLAELQEDYETFALTFDGVWNFCKTAHEPYDVAVKCILILAKEYNLLENNKDLGEGDFSWDGDEDDPEYLEAMEIINAYKISKNNS